MNAAAPMWSERLLGWRDRLLVSPAFHARVARWPLFRWVARRRARELFDLCAGFVYSQVLYACVRLDLFERLADGPRPLVLLARDMGLPVDAAERLLEAAVALRLVERRGEARYGLGLLGGALLANPGVVAMVAHHAILYRDLTDPVALLRGETEPAMSRYWAYARSDAPGALHGDAVAEYSALMAASQPLVADEILRAYPFAKHRRMFDIGGGEGVFAAAVARAAPRLALTLVDLAPVIERARVRFAHAGLADRVQVHAADFRGDALPVGADLISLVRVLHDHDDATVLALLQKVRASLAPGGVLVIAEPMAASGASVPVGDAYFSLYLLAMGSGRARTVAQLAELLGRAGFAAPQVVGSRRPMQVQVLTARVSPAAVRPLVS